jgi:hypothetical protein
MYREHNGSCLPSYDMLEIPNTVRKTILPDPTLTIASFAWFPLPKVTHLLPKASEYLSTDKPNCEHLHDIILHDAPPDFIVQKLHGILHKNTDIQSIIPVHNEHLIDKRYSPWIVTYWTELIPLRKVQQQWAMSALRLADTGVITSWPSFTLCGGCTHRPS